MLTTVLNGCLAYFVGIYVIQALVALIQGTFTLEQMQNRWPDHRQFLPFSRHPGFWSDLLWVSPLLAFLWSRHSHKWGVWGLAVAALAAAVLSWIMLKVWEKGSTIVFDSCAWEGVTRLNGYVHGLYMIPALTIVFLYFFNTKVSNKLEAVLVTAALFAHVVVGTVGPSQVARGYVDDQAGAVVRWGGGLLIGACVFLVWRSR